MIVGIGTDLANIDRIQGVLSRYGDRFKNRVFTEIEQAKASRRKDEAGTYAKRWAAKEACSKALGIGLRMGISWKDMHVVNLRSGKPELIVEGKAKDILIDVTPAGYIPKTHLSLTDDFPWAKAIVIIEGIRDTKMG